jgi:hypothetical protein
MLPEVLNTKKVCTKYHGSISVVRKIKKKLVRISNMTLGRTRAFLKKLLLVMTL